MSSIQITHVHGDSIPQFDKVNIIIPIDKGELFIMPTDTFWGIGVSPGFPKSIRKLFDIKQRPPDMPFPLFPADYDMAEQLIGTSPSLMFKLAVPAPLFDNVKVVAAAVAGVILIAPACVQSSPDISPTILWA